jgi:hypothetical protein
MSHVCCKVCENVQGIHKQTTAFRKYEATTVLYKCWQVYGMRTGCEVQGYCSEATPPNPPLLREKHDPESVTWQPLKQCNVMRSDKWLHDFLHFHFSQDY